MKVRFVGFAIFILFFGAAALDAVQTRDWLRSIFWLAMGLVFLLLDMLRRPALTK